MSDSEDSCDLKVDPVPQVRLHKCQISVIYWRNYYHGQYHLIRWNDKDYERAEINDENNVVLIEREWKPLSLELDTRTIDTIYYVEKTATILQGPVIFVKE